jgi:undecaprenyl-diphosphatase
MGLIQAIILGIVQGVTEFLPISSSGHLVLFQKLFGLTEGVITFDVAVHLATLIAVFIVFKDDIFDLIRKPFTKLTYLLIVGTIPAVIFGLLFKDVISTLFESGKSLGFEFLLTGLALLYAENVQSRNKKLGDTGYSDAALIGTAQAIAILPAISRSGLTIAGALARGLNREFAAKFSFLLSIPAILGAAVLDLKDIVKLGGSAGFGVDLIPLIGGMVAAAISGYFAIRFMLKLLTKGSLKGFAYYVFILAALVLADQLFIGRFFEKLF